MVTRQTYCVHREVHHDHADMLMVPFRVLCAVRLDFEGAGGSIVSHYLSNYLLQGYHVTVKMTWALFLVKCGNTQKSTHPLFGRIIR